MDPDEEDDVVTIQDVARTAGVSAMTVSNVINDRPHVRPSTRAKVVRAMDDLGYRVNVAARNLRAGRTSTIGLAVAEIDRPYWGQLAARIIREAARHNLQVLIEQTGAQRSGEIDALGRSRNRMYDGLILSTVGLGPADADLLRVDQPVVILGERIFDGPVDHVAMANQDGGRIAVEHLIERGCRRIAFLDGDDGDDEISVSALRAVGYRQALQDAGLTLDPRRHVRIADFTMAGGRAGVAQLLAAETEFDGVFCITDTVAIGALRGLADAGVDVPGQVKVIGFDDVEEADYTTPSLTSIDPDHDLMARTAVDLLVARIAGDDRARVEFTSPARLVVRDST
ncbi:LacI family DNA-binding transcriptional regulator [Curtobacterium sp. AB451]|uniref:LacI family DNA-binding transcriptional regulator n=1 Tax=unclassified Curtobacterium TaxID=257496 RepID=UPI00380B1D71